MISPKVTSSGQRPFATHGNQSRKTMRLPVLANARETVWVFEGIESRGAEDRASARQDARAVLARQREDFVFKKSQPPVADSQHFRAVRICATNDGTNSCVQT